MKENFGETGKGTLLESLWNLPRRRQRQRHKSHNWVSGNNLVWISIHDLGRRANAPPLFPGCFRRPGSNMSLDTALRRGGGLRAPSGIPRGTTCESHENDLRQPGAQTGRIFFGKETKQVRDLLESKVHATTTLWITLTGCFLVLEDFC